MSAIENIKKGSLLLMNRNARCLLGMQAMLLGLALLLTGCESEDTDFDVTATRLSLDRDLLSYTSVDSFTWDTTLSKALATIHIKDFTHGDATLKVFDAHGKQILHKALVTPNDTYYVGDNEYVASEMTDQGEPGKWRIELTYNQFTGEVTLTME